MKKNPLLAVLILLVFFTTQASSQQLKLLNLIQPYAVTLSGTNQNVIVEFENIGNVTVTSAQFGYDLNGVGSISSTWNGSLTPGSKTSFNIGNITVSAGTNDLIVTVWDANGSSTTYADTVLFKIQTPGVLNIPYTDDFEGIVKWGTSSFSWLPGDNPSGWQLAVPNYGVITPSPTPTAWVMGLDSG